MGKIIYTDRLEFGGEHLPVHLASDRQIYVLLDDLCKFIGLGSDGMVERIQQDVSTADVLLFMTVPGDDTPPTQEPCKAAFLNLAALPYWLGKVSAEMMTRPDLHGQLVRYTFDFLDTTWMLYRAAAHQLEHAWVTRTRIGGSRSRTRRPIVRPRG